MRFAISLADRTQMLMFFLGFPGVQEPEKEDTGKDFTRFISDEVWACKWPGKEEEDDKSGVRVAKQATIKKGVNGYSWSSIKEQQRKDPCV